MKAVHPGEVRTLAVRPRPIGALAGGRVPDRFRRALRESVARRLRWPRDGKEARRRARSSCGSGSGRRADSRSRRPVRLPFAARGEGRSARQTAACCSSRSSPVREIGVQKRRARKSGGDRVRLSRGRRRRRGIETGSGSPSTLPHTLGIAGAPAFAGHRGASRRSRPAPGSRRARKPRPPRQASRHRCRAGRRARGAGRSGERLTA